MAKQGMKRPDLIEKPKNEPVVARIQGKAKSGKKKATPIVAGTSGADQKVRHSTPIPKTYGMFDNDLARENLEQDIPFADQQDM